MMYNKYQTSYEELNLEKEPDEVREQFDDFMATVPFLQYMAGDKRLRAKDLPRDDQGRIIVDITKPHILEDMDYFRPSAIHYLETGRYCDWEPNKNPNSPYMKWATEETRRCWEGYVRESDGEWIPGDYYFFLNYCPMNITEKKKGRKAIRKLGFPEVWDGHYLKFHYLQQARENGNHAAELASRGKGKSISGAAMLAKRFFMGESSESREKVVSYITASDKKYLFLQGDQTLDKFEFIINFVAQRDELPWPKLRITSSLQSMQWQSGYVDSSSKIKKGVQNSVVGVSSNDDVSRLRGSRGVLYIMEEFGTFKGLIDIYNNIRHSVEEGQYVFGLLYSYGTAGDNESDFKSAQEMVDNPRGYNIYALENVFDKVGQGRQLTTYFFPGYMNRAGNYDKDGNSDVTHALLEIVKDRYAVKYNSTNVSTITKRIAEYPVTIREAMLKSRGNMFPVADLNERLVQIYNNPSIMDNVYNGMLSMDSTSKVSFMVTNEEPITDFPLKDNKAIGCVQIFAMPEKEADGKPFRDRYILGVDPVDSDSANTLSLYSVFVFDLWTDMIVAEWTGRLPFADDCHEVARKLCLFYNGKIMYENNIKGLYAYFMKMQCLYLLADTPEYLKDKDLVKTSNIGNRTKGVTASAGVNDYANVLIKDWLTQPVPVIEKNEQGIEEEKTVRNLFRLKNVALIKELIAYTPVINVDRIRALGMLMLYRQEKIILYQGNPRSAMEYSDSDYTGNDDFFSRNYDKKLTRQKENSLSL